MPIETFMAPEEAREKRLDSFLASKLASFISRMKVKELILSGKVTVNGQTVKPNFLIYPGQNITADFEMPSAALVRAENIPLEIIYEDSDLVVVNKPAGMVVHPACGHSGGTLVNALLFHSGKLSKAGGELRAGIIHRLDKDTSGLLIVAKNDATHEALARQFKDRHVRKIYWAVVKGVAHHDEMQCDEAIGRSLHDRRKIVFKSVEDGGKACLTHLKVLKRFKNATLLEVRPETGRMHQIRVHLKLMGYPVFGDKEYGTPSPHIKRQALHAKEISFVHPKTKKKLSFESDLPPDMQNLLSALKKEGR